jgi:hypothetical protein
MNTRHEVSNRAVNRPSTGIRQDRGLSCARRPRGDRGPWAGLALSSLGCWLGLQGGMAQAQETSELITTQLPFPQYVAINDDHYSLRIGRVQLRYDVSLEGIFTDNRNLVDEDKESDFGLRPMLTLGLFYPVNDRQKIQVDVGVGYQWWSKVQEQNRFFVMPRSHLSYVLGVGDVDLSLSNTTASSSEANSRVEIAGGPAANGVPGSDLAFNRINNTTTLAAGWQPGRMGFRGNYSFLVDRSLNDQFVSLDQNRHTFGGAIDYKVSAPITVGLAGNYSIYTYLEDIQNDGSGYSITPTVAWQLRDNLSFDAAVGYGQSDFDRTGTVQDNDGFSGLTYNVAIRHQLNKRMNHSATFSRGADPGLGSNFTDRFQVGYQFAALISPVLRPFLGFAYESASMSGVDGEDADLFRVNVGVGYPVLRRATLGLNYNVAWRVADDPTREYMENRVSLTASYRF